MIKRKLFRNPLILTTAILLLVSAGFGLFYNYWNSASPSKTCASCHEIESSVNVLFKSAHRELACKECHGTALSNGLHSLKEKGMMVINHVKNDRVEDIRLSEKQLLEVMDNCIRCHTLEHARWQSGGHSAKYRDIFMDRKHNTTEQLNFDCLRCHGMFSEVPVNELVEPLDTKGPWKFKDENQAKKPAILCLTCHQIHQEGFVNGSPDYAKPRSAFYHRKTNVSKAGFYNRHDKTHIPAENLPVLKLNDGNRWVKVSDDPMMRNCIQCHAPGAHHLAGTSDDRTPLGVHEGISCLTCHDPHSNDARQSCNKCHPAISHCKLDVKTMNTSYADARSVNNIHSVACNNCHKEKILRK